MGAAFGTAQANTTCSPAISQGVLQQANAVAAFRQNAMQQVVVPPPAPSMIANTPCFSKELQRVTDTFSSMPQNFMSGMTSGLAGIAGPASGMMNQFFEAGMLSMNQAAQSVPAMLDFQSLASDALSNLLGGLGASSGFSSELCGMMVDVVVNFLQCQLPLELPEFPSFDLGFGSLNDLLPDGCAGNAMREGIYAAAGASKAWDVFSQPVSMGEDGKVVPGNAQQKSQENRAKAGAR